MSDFLQLVVTGIENGMAYALVALSLVLIYKTAKVLNFAQGTLAGLAGYLAYWYFARVGLPWLVAAFAALVSIAVFAVILERLTVRPLLKSGFFSIVIATLAVDQFMSNATERLFGTSPLPFSPPLEGQALDLGGVRITKWTLVVILVGLASLLVVTYIVNRTELGLAMRAFADDQAAAQLMGVSNAAVSRATWVLSITLGGVIGIVLAPILFLQTGYMQGSFINGFTGAILGGFTSLSGGVLGGLVLGLIDSFAVRYAPQALIGALPLLIVLVILLIRPNGLFVRDKAVERV